MVFTETIFLSYIYSILQDFSKRLEEQVLDFFLYNNNRAREERPMTVMSAEDFEKILKFATENDRTNRDKISKS